MQQKINLYKKKLESEYHEKEKTLKAELSKEKFESSQKLKEEMESKYQQYIFNNF